jgi:uncharacterized protein (TIGR02118 family)
MLHQQEPSAVAIDQRPSDANWAFVVALSGAWQRVGARRTEETDQMVRFIALYDQPEDAEAFDRHYREVHIPLAKKLPGLRRYTISRNARPSRGADAYYLVAELDWDDMDALERDFRSPEGEGCQNS